VNFRSRMERFLISSINLASGGRLSKRMGQKGVSVDSSFFVSFKAADFGISCPIELSEATMIRQA
jgi:hypothetical protein